MNRRAFISRAAAFSGGLAFVSQLPRVTAAETKLPAQLVKLHPEVEPLVRMLEQTPRERVLEEVASKIKKGTTYREIVAALLLAGVRNIQPRPIGFKFHAVLVVNSAHLASLASPEQDRWLPIFWAIDQFKSSQAADESQGDWALGPVDEAAVPPSHKAKQALIEALDNWDEAGADAAIVGMLRTAGAHEIFDLLCRYGVRDFREIGHKEIYVANSFRALEVIGWHHAEPVLRSLVYGLLDRDGERQNPAQADLPADRPFRRSVQLAKDVRAGWLDGKNDSEATRSMLEAIRQGSAADTSARAVELLNRGVSAQSLFDAFFDGAGELLMRQPGILSLHATTFTNATHYAFQHCRDTETRKLLLLQNAAFMPLFRGNSVDKGIHIDSMEPLALKADGTAAIEEIFANLKNDRLGSARKVLSLLKGNADPKPFADAARRLIFLKGTDSHDYKFSSAVLEDYQFMSAPWRDRYLAASVFYLKSPADGDSAVAQRTRAAFNA